MAHRVRDPHRIHHAFGVDSEAADRARAHGTAGNVGAKVRAAFEQLDSARGFRPPQAAPTKARSDARGEAWTAADTTTPEARARNTEKARRDLALSLVRPGRVPCAAHAAAAGTPCFGTGRVPAELGGGGVSGYCRERFETAKYTPKGKAAP